MLQKTEKLQIKQDQTDLPAMCFKIGRMAEAL